MPYHPKVSVILTSYNKEKYIGKAIESVLGQTLEDFELIIVDDGSKDDSIDVIEAYKKKDCRIKTFYLEENEGIPSAHNMAISMASGEYLAMIDCDDFWEKTKLEKQIDFLKENQQYGACFSWIKVVDENENELLSEQCENRDIMWNSENHTQGEWLRLLFTNGCVLGNPSMVVRKNIISQIASYSYGLKQIQDYELFIRILKKCNVYIIKEKLVNYRWFIESEKNTSYNNVENSNRTNVEYFLICQSFFDYMDAKIFKEGFSNYFIFSEAEEESELLCEQIFLLNSHFFIPSVGKMAAIQKAYKYLNDDHMRQVLRKHYNYTSASFSENLKTSLLYDSKYYAPIDNNTFVADLMQQLNIEKAEHHKAVVYIEELEIKAKEATKLIDEYQIAHENSKNYIGELEIRAKEAAELINEYRIANKNSKDYIEELEIKMKEAVKLIDEYQIANENLKNYVNELEVKAKEAARLINEYQSINENSKNYIEELETKSRQADKLISEYQVEYENSKMYIKELEEKLKEASGL